MQTAGPQCERVNRRVLAALCLAVVLVVAANPAAPLHPDKAGAASVHTPQDDLVTQDRCVGGCQLAGGLSLASIFPFTGDRETPTRTDREIVGLDDERAGDLFEVLATETARELLRQLLAEPGTASDLSEDVDTSLQNVHYHLENLREAGAITEIDVEYSSRGREMTVYAATCRPQVAVYDVE